MKLNWGTSIVLAFVAFIAFILYFVIRVGIDEGANHELVTEEYYKKELAYQKEIDAESAAVKMNAQLRVEKTESGLVVHFPKEFKPENIKGKVSLYRPSNGQLDFDFPISLSNSHLLIPESRLLGGRWDVIISWSCNGHSFLHKEKISY